MSKEQSQKQAAQQRSIDPPTPTAIPSVFGKARDALEMANRQIENQDTFGALRALSDAIAALIEVG